MLIYMVRHTAVDVAKGICYGQSDVGLAPSFATELEVVNTAIADLHFDAVYASPLQRCKRLALGLGLTPNLDDRLMEMHFGDWEMRPWDELREPYVQQWMDNYTQLPCPNGESMQDMLARMRSFLDSIGSEIQTALVFTHGGPIRCAYNLLKGIPLSEVFNVKVGYGSLHQFSLCAV